MLEKRLRYGDLLALGIIKNRQTLRNWISLHGFPSGQQTGPNSRTWSESEVQAWIAARPTKKKPAPVVKGRRGRPRNKTERQATTGA